MDRHVTTELFHTQPFCNGARVNYFVASAPMDMPTDPAKAGAWTKAQRERRGISAAELAKRINGLAVLDGDPTSVSQQVISKFEQGNAKRNSSWQRFIVRALEDSDGESKEDAHLHMALSDASVQIKLLPTWVGLGSGGTGDDDPGLISFSKDLVERELRAQPDQLLAMVAEGNSMEPDFRGGDQILVDTRRKSLAQPGAFCLWDGDGHVIKFLEKVPGSDPPMVRIVALNSIYTPYERGLDEINLVGRVVWFGRRVQ